MIAIAKEGKKRAGAACHTRVQQKGVETDRQTDRDTETQRKKEREREREIGVVSQKLTRKIIAYAQQDVSVYIYIYI